MRKLVLLCGLVVLSLAAVATAGASQPQTASGTVEVVDLAVTPAGVAGGNELYHITATAIMAGTFAGTLSSDSIEVLHPTGNSTANGTGTCVCTVEGRTGTVVFRTEVRITGDPFFYEDKSTIVSATGGLAGLHGSIRTQWDGGLATYTGSYHFDP